MKKHLFILAVSSFLISFTAFSQVTSNLEVFSENVMPFTLSVNGVTQNEKAANNVKVENLEGEFHMLSVQFADASLGSVRQNFVLEPGMEQKAIIVLKKKGSYAIRPFGEPTAISTAEVNSEPAIRQGAKSDEHINRKGEHTPSAPNDVISTGTSGTINMSMPDGESINMTIDIAENGISINSEMNGGTSVNTHLHHEQSPDMNEVAFDETARAEPATSQEGVFPICRPMDNSSFATAKKSISSKSFSNEKHITAKQVLKNNCMSTDQIIKVIDIFNFEDDKLTFAKYAYDRCSDVQNYWKVNDAFTMSSSIIQLDEYLKTK